VAPCIEGGLRLLERAEVTPVEHFALERAMEAFVLALGLGMIGTAVDHGHVEVEQPDGQRGMALAAAGRPPWRAIVRQDAAGQAVAGENPLQLAAHRARPLVVAGPDRQGIARMVVQHREGMAAPRLHRKMALEIHLPQIVGLGVLIARPFPRLTTARTFEQPVAPQDRRDRRGRGNKPDTIVEQNPPDLATTPHRMLRTHRQNLPLKLVARPARTAQRAPRTLKKPRRTILPVPRKPLVANSGTHPKPPAQPAKIDPFHLCKTAKLLSLRQRRTLLERHGSPPCQKCSPCLRTPVHYVSGLYTLKRRGERR
jgi:hypothetical protein